MNINAIKPIGPHVTGVIRFASEDTGGETRQLDDFEVLSRVHLAPESETHWPKLAPHAVSMKLRKPNEKLQRIAVKLVFDKPENNLQARYEAFDTGINRLVCVGDGDQCSRAGSDGSVTTEKCSGPDSCEFGNAAGRKCDLQVRMAVQVEGQPDPLSVFELQSNGIHTYRTLAAKLAMLHTVLGGLRHVPLELCMYEKSSPAFGFVPFYVADLQLRDGVTLAEAAAAIKSERESGTTQALAFDKLDAAVEQMRAQMPLAIGDTDHGIVMFAARAPASRTRASRETTGQGARAVADVVQTARQTASVLAGGGEPIVLKPERDDAGARASDSTIESGRPPSRAELPPTPI